MKFFLTLFLSMSASGTLAFLIYLTFTFLFQERISARFRYLSLKFCLALFLVPFPLIKHLLVSALFPKILAPFDGSEVFLDISHSLNLTDTGVLFPKISSGYRTLLLCWLLILAGILCSQFRRYLVFQKHITRCLLRDHQYDALLSSLKKISGVRRPVAVYHSNSGISPFTCGIFHPVIVLTSLVSPESAPLILQHEMQHIRTHDFFYRVLAMFAVLLHCYNPCIYFLFKELKEVQEMYCDETITSNFSAEEKRNYGKIILDVSTNAEAETAPAIYFSKTNKSFLKKRLRRIISPVHGKFFYVPALFLFMLFSAAIPVYAYSPSTLDWRESDEETQKLLNNTDWIILAEDFPRWYDIPKDERTFLNFDTYFILETGTIIPLTGKPSAGLQAKCRHSYQSGTLKEHALSATGCIVITYSAQFCSKCSSVKNKVEIGRAEYKPCPHK